MKPQEDDSSETGSPQETSLPTSREAYAAYENFTKMYYEYEVQNLAHTAKVFRWQYASSVVIFWVVIILVLSGLILACIQFRFTIAGHKATKGSSKKDILNPDETDFRGSSTIEASLKGVKITSSVIGLLILALSMGFFYLYLVHVYPIHEVGR